MLKLTQPVILSLTKRKVLSELTLRSSYYGVDRAIRNENRASIYDQRGILVLLKYNIWCNLG